MSNTVGYSLGCVAPVRYNLTQGEDATGNAVASSVMGCSSGCLNADYRDRRYWARIPLSATTTSGTDYYGALAPTLKFQGGGTYRDICPTVCYCEGPTAEGETVEEYLGRYETRWMALLSEGLIYYGRVDGVLIQAPLALFADPLPDTATHIALAFDANARPCFAYEDDGTIYLRRYVAGVPTTYSWVGVSPCLFFNGVVNFDDTQTDVVCYHLTEAGGVLYARIQRENFGVENPVLEDPGLDFLMAVDRGRGALASHMVVELSGRRVLASVYPPWPILAQDVGLNLVHAIEQLEYGLVVKDLGTYAEQALNPTHSIESISYDSVAVVIDAGGEQALDPAHAIEQIEYPLIGVATGPYEESGEDAAHAIEQLEYDLVSVAAGTYTENGTNVAHSIEEITYE